MSTMIGVRELAGFKSTKFEFKIVSLDYLGTVKQSREVRRVSVAPPFGSSGTPIGEKITD